MPKYKIVSTPVFMGLRDNQNRPVHHQPGDTIELTEEQAAGNANLERVGGGGAPQKEK